MTTIIENVSKEGALDNDVNGSEEIIDISSSNAMQRSSEKIQNQGEPVEQAPVSSIEPEKQTGNALPPICLSGEKLFCDQNQEQQRQQVERFNQEIIQFLENLRKEDSEGNAEDHLSKAGISTEPSQVYTVHDHILLGTWPERVISMMEMHTTLELSQQVLFTSVMLFNLYLEYTSRPLSEEGMELAGFVSLIVANNFTDLNTRPACRFTTYILEQKVKQHKQPISEQELSRMKERVVEQCQQMQKYILELTDQHEFVLNAPHADSLLAEYAKCICADERFLLLTSFILEVSLVDRDFVQEESTPLACAVLYYCMLMADAHRKETNKTNSQPVVSVAVAEWNESLIRATGLRPIQFQRELLNLHFYLNGNAKSHDTIFMKYSQVAMINPLNFDQIRQICYHKNKNEYSQ